MLFQFCNRYKYFEIANFIDCGQFLCVMRKKVFFSLDTEKVAFPLYQVVYYNWVFLRLRTEKGLFRSHDKKSYFSLLFFITETLFLQKSAFLSGFFRYFFQKKENFQFHLLILTWKKVLFVLRPQRCFFSPFYFVTRLRLVTKKEARKSTVCGLRRKNTYLFWFFFLNTKKVFSQNNWQVTKLRYTI